jgi:hypothetical protein
MPTPVAPLPAVIPSPLSKRAFTVAPGLDSSTVMDRATRYGPAGLAIGAGAAGLVNLLGELRRQKTEAKMQADLAAGKADSDTLVVRVPQKTAAPGWLLKTLAGSAAAGVGAIGYAMGHTPTPQETAVKAKQPNYAWDGALSWGIPAAAGIGGYALVDAIMRRRKQNDMQGQLEKAKTEYSQMLGQTLGDPQAKSAAVHYPALEGFIAAMAEEFTAPPSIPSGSDKTASMFSQFTSSPVTLALLSAAVAHKFVHDQEVAADAAHQVKRFAPPKAIRIETIPRPVEALPAPSAAMESGESVPIEEEIDPERKKKQAGLGDLAELGAVAAFAGNKKEKRERGAAEEEPAEPSPEPVIHDLSRNEAIINTSGGATEIQAADPQAAALLQRRKGRLARLLAVSAANS